MQVFLWNTETLKQKSILEEHSQLITDVRFSPSTPFLATSSFDKTVRVWDTDNVNVRHQSMFPTFSFDCVHMLSHARFTMQRFTKLTQVIHVPAKF